MWTECPKNVENMSEECAQKLSRGTANTIFGHFLGIFCLFGRCFCLVTLSNARPLQRKSLRRNVSIGLTLALPIAECRRVHKAVDGCIAEIV